MPLYNLSYGYNRFFYDMAQGECVKISSVSKPTKCLLAADLEYVFGAYEDGSNMSSYVPAVIGNINNHCDWGSKYFSYRHMDTARVLYVDGHVSNSRSRVDGFPEDIYFYEGGLEY
jgi:prepilin-type processing-associated H-X9-DG protein